MPGCWEPLVHDLALGVAEGANRGDVDDPVELRLQGGAQHIVRPDHVRLVHGPVLRLGIRPRRPRPRGSPHEPSIPARMASLSERVPGTSSQPSSVSAAPFSGLRTSARTSSPRSRSWLATWPPMNPVPPVRKTFIRAETYKAGKARVRRIAEAAAARPTLGRVQRAAKVAQGKPTTEPAGRGVENRRARQRAIAIAALPASPGDDDVLAELKELLRTAGVATAGELVQIRARPDPDRYLGRGQAGPSWEIGDRAQRRQPGRL